MFIQTEPTPNPATMKFLPGRAVLDGGTLDMPTREAAHQSPLAARLFDIPNVGGVFFGIVALAITAVWGENRRGIGALPMVFAAAGVGGDVLIRRAARTLCRYRPKLRGRTAPLALAAAVVAAPVVWLLPVLGAGAAGGFGAGGVRRPHGAPRLRRLVLSAEVVQDLALAPVLRGVVAPGHAVGERGGRRGRLARLLQERRDTLALLLEAGEVLQCVA